MRLASGRLFLASDFQNIRILTTPPPEDIKDREAFVALSDDEGRTWKIKCLALAPPHNGWTGKPPPGNGKTRMRWSWFPAENGTPALQDKETWFYENGRRQYVVTRASGKMLGSETYFCPDGSRQWKRRYDKAGAMIWTVYWPNGKKKSESRWQGGWAQGWTTGWDDQGKVLRKINFKDGKNLSGPPHLGDD